MKKWPWIIYGMFLTLLVFSALGDIFYSDSPLRTYYTVLVAFNAHYKIYFSLNIISILINLLAPLVVFLYALNIESPRKFWRIFIFVRLFFDLAGHHYDLQFMKSAYFQNYSYFLACIGAFTLPLFPSYMAHYLYAFKAPAVKKY